LEDLAAPEKSGPERSSMLSDIAQHQRSVLENAYAPMDEAALAKMPLLQLQTYLTQRKIDSNYASALLDANWNVLKSARQSVDTVLNSK
jgi:hypothetical protein